MQTPEVMKRSFFFPAIFFLIWYALSGFCPAGDEDNLYRVVWVKGKPLNRSGEPLRDGQKLTGTDVFRFSGPEDVVVLMNNRFDRIRLKPGNGIGTGKAFPVYVLIEQESRSQRLASAPARSLNGASTRGAGEPKYFQSLSDTLRLGLREDLKMDENPVPESYQLLDHFIEEMPGLIRVSGGELRIAAPGAGIFFLNHRPPGLSSRILAEIEFFDPAEVQAELRFVAGSSAPPDSARPNQVRFLRKLYPNVTEREVQMLVLK